VVDPPSIIATHFTEIIKKYASEILGRQGVKTILDTLKNDYPAVIEEINKMFSVGEIHKVLQGLLKEQVSIRNIIQILETLADYGDVTKNPGFLIEKARQALRRQICAHYADENNSIRVLTLAPELEQTIIDSKMETTTGLVAALEPGMQRRWISALVNAVKAVQDKGITPVILCSEAARPLIKSSSLREVPHLVVLSVPEIIPDITVESVGEIALITS
jgi:flagellar biosynthesis protein FlhA